MWIPKGAVLIRGEVLNSMWIPKGAVLIRGEALNSMWIPKGAVLIRGRRLLEEIWYARTRANTLGLKVLKEQV